MTHDTEYLPSDEENHRVTSNRIDTLFKSEFIEVATLNFMSHSAAQAMWDKLKIKVEGNTP